MLFGSPAPPGENPVIAGSEMLQILDESHLDTSQNSYLRGPAHLLVFLLCCSTQLNIFWKSYFAGKSVSIRQASSIPTSGRLRYSRHCVLKESSSTVSPVSFATSISFFKSCSILLRTTITGVLISWHTRLSTASSVPMRLSTTTITPVHHFKPWSWMYLSPPPWAAPTPGRSKNAAFTPFGSTMKTGGGSPPVVSPTDDTLHACFF